MFIEEMKTQQATFALSLVQTRPCSRAQPLV